MTTNSGDLFTAVQNEHIWNADGSLTVNALHLYLFGPTDVGEVVLGRVTCGTAPGPARPPDARAPTCNANPVALRTSVDDPSPKEPRTEVIGVFDTGGLQHIMNISSSNAQVTVGQPLSDQPYLRHVPGQTGPLTVTAVRDDPALPMSWGFDAIDTAGNTTSCGSGSPPVANDDAYTTYANTPLTVAAPGVLANDTDPDVDSLTAASAVATSHPGGSTTLNSNGSFTFTPSSGFTGVASFGYTAHDGNGGTDQATVSITVSPTPPTIAVGDVRITEGDTGGRVAYFPVSLSAPSTSPVTVNYTTANGTAEQPADYTATSGKLTFAAGQVNKVVGVVIKGDTEDEDNHKFTLRLSTAENATIADGVGVGTILDDDVQSGVKITISDVTGREGKSGDPRAFYFTVSLSRAVSSTVTVNFATADGTALAPTDYVAKTGTLTFSPGAALSQRVTITTKADTLVESNESFRVRLSGLVGPGAIADTVGIGTLVNDDG